MNDALIRQATEADILSISQLQQQWLAEGSFYGSLPDGQEHIQTALGPYFLVATVSGLVVGFLAGSVHVSEGTVVIPRGRSYIELDSLYVTPQCRRQGIGSKLVTQVLAQAKTQGVTHALLYSANKDLHSIIRFYEQHHFQSWYLRMFQEL